jgi:hypothetical protein
MAFINERISEQEIAAYRMDELQQQFRPDSRGWRDGRPGGFIHIWTIDRENDVFLVPVHIIHDVGPSGRLEPTSRSVWVLCVHGRRARVVLERTADSSVKFEQTPYRICWRLIELDRLEIADVPLERLVELLKDALTVYGEFGALLQVPSTHVEFDF